MAETEKMLILQSPTFHCDEFSTNKEGNALDRVAQLPVVACTWNVMHTYYSNVKRNYPNISPYLETAEKLTCSAANIALTTSRPVVDKLAPTVNSYANQGLDTLEHTVPLITKQPEEIYKQTKNSTASLLTSQVNNVLDTTEKYVDYYLPGDEMEQCSSDEKEDDHFDDSYSDEEIEEKHVRDRIREISNKVQRRSYRKAMAKWRGLHAGSREALGKLNFTVDLIQYAQESVQPSNLASSANDKIVSGVLATIDGFQYAADSINKKVEEQVLVRARKLSGQLNESCARAVDHLQSYPKMHHLLEQATKAKEATEDLVMAFADKTSISQLPSAIATATRPKVKLVEDTLLAILEALVDQPPLDWLAPEVKVDPLDGLNMRDIEAQLYGVPPRRNVVENRSTRPGREHG